ncbi:beta-1,3-galactosyltransferase 5-like [Paramacrobiotus metropolitanus]|uniref:beta-1,3-galactosyltransferase 5-like n=1 Tax=Paramacrobiotus metropolitanus TaxID=2943436 RepID=UPI002445FDE5|nr:beta-1,3-galactosyltransferase 5-like [Paramacrobiotus metropolitanus]
MLQNCNNKIYLRIAVIFAAAILVLCVMSFVGKRRFSNDFTDIELPPKAKRKTLEDHGASLTNASSSSRYQAAIARQYTIMPKTCAEMPVKPFLVLIVFSRIDAFDLRTAIRTTWGSLADTKCGIRLLFMFGRVYKDNLQRKLEAEAEKYGDIIQSNQFDDVYRSAAQKAIHLLQWSAAFCPESVYTAKIDDDNWLNLPMYYKFLQTHQHTDYVYGAVFYSGTTVIRHTGTKYYVPREEYSGDYYPEYLSGILYAFPTRFVQRILQASLEVPRTFNDDVYVCGMLTNKANLTRKAVPNYAWDQNSAQRDSKCTKKDMMCIHYSNAQDYYRMWKDPCYTYERIC